MNRINDDGKILVNLAFLLSKPTGISNYALNLLPYLQKLQPILLVGEKRNGYKCELISGNLTPEQGKLGHFRRLLWTETQLPSLYRRRKASLLFSPVPEAPIWGDCHYVVMVHDLIPLRFPRLTSPLTPYFRYYIPRVLHQSAHIICNSKATAEDITQFFGISETKITPIYLAYDQTHFRPLPGLDPPRQPYFLYLGRHDPHKNLPRVIEAYASIASECAEELWLAGPGDRRYTPQLQQQALALGITHRLRFLNYVPYQDLPQLFNQATALVYPSLWEGFGLPVLEAMACGTPVITSNLSSLPEIAGDAALLVDPYEVESIAAAMITITENQQMRSRCIALGFQQAGKYSWAQTGEATCNLLCQYLF